MVRVISFHAKPLISVVIPYNEDRGFLNCAVGSVALQSYRRIELILVHADKSVGKNINTGVMKARGSWIKILAEDDLLPPDSLKILSKNIKDCDWIVANAWNFGKARWTCEFIGQVPTLDGMLTKNQVHGGAVLYNKRLFYETGGFDETLVTAEEYDFHLLLLAKEYVVKYVPEIVYHYRVHDTNKYINMRDKLPNERYQYVNYFIKARYDQRFNHVITRPGLLKPGYKFSAKPDVPGPGADSPKGESSEGKECK
jgi:glycosyltransferase involved in cell wall biosynthesis